MRHFCVSVVLLRLLVKGQAKMHDHDWSSLAVVKLKSESKP